MKIQYIFLWILSNIILIASIWVGDLGLGEFKILVCIILMVIIYLISLSELKRTNGEEPILSDGRFYFISFTTLYSVWVPILSILTGISTKPFLPLKISKAIPYGVEEMIKTCGTSITMLMGISLGIFIVNKLSMKDKLKRVALRNENNVYHKKWFYIMILSTFIFLYPFLNGGFEAMKSGGSILDVEQVSTMFSGNIIMTAIGFLFSSEVMTISTAAFLMYYINSNNSVRKKALVCVLLLCIHTFIALATTRSARFVIILVCLFASTMANKQIRSHPLFKKILKLILIFMVLIYFLDYIIVNEVREGFKAMEESTIVEMMRRFDGTGPYDALFRAVDSSPDISMIQNIPFSFLRPIPIVGDIILSIIGMNTNYSPLYGWMSNQYIEIYSSGGGLAYMPQIEAFLTLGYVGCFLYGLVYGLIFGKKRKGIGNIIIIAMGLMLARGSFGVIASLSIPYIGICYLFYEKFLFRISLKRKVTKAKSNTILLE